MISDLWHSRAASRLRKGRVALLLVALALVGALSVSALAYSSNKQAADPASMTLEEMERAGKVILAYEHDGPEDLENKVADASQGGFVIYVKADGVTTSHRATGGTPIADVLEMAGVELGPEDEMTHFPGRMAEPGDTIVVTRWTRDTATTEVPVDYATVEVPTSLLFPGKQMLVHEGAPGVKQQTWSRLLKDGEVVEQELQGEEITVEPTPRKILVGTDKAPISPLNYNWEFDESGKPVNYQTVLTGQRAAGYSAGPGAGTASGHKAQVGYVAVDPSEIPYGTKLFIQSADGRFVYGYALAADTGVALKQDVIDVDLFYGSYAESVQNSIREVDIYILEYPSK